MSRQEITDNDRKRGYVSITRFLLGLVLLLGMASCKKYVPLYDTTGGFTKDQLVSGLEISISKKEFDKIKKKRAEALQVGHHFKSKEDFVKCKLECAGRSYKVKMRLKGDELDHLEGDYWSYRIKSKLPLAMGHKKFSLQGPSLKSYLLEFLFHKVCQQEGILALDYFFLPVIINDTINNVYAFESFPDSSMLKKSGRAIGPILKFEEISFWREFMTGKRNIDSLYMLSSKIKTVNNNWVKEDSLRSILVNDGKEKLDSYRKGEAKGTEVFDFNLFAQYVAISELFGSSHNLRWINLRFYYNPHSKLVEPIAFDCYDGQDPRNEVIWYQQKQRFEYFLHPLLNDLDFQKKVEAYLKVYCQKQYVKSIFSDHHHEITRYMKLIRIDCPDYLLSRNQMLRRAKHILNTVSK